MNIKNKLLKVTKNRQKTIERLIYLGIAIAIVIAIVSTKNLNLIESLEALIARSENQYQQWGDSQSLAQPWVLIPFAAGGGLLASISPCILAMLPVNLSYIGTLNPPISPCSLLECHWIRVGCHHRLEHLRAIFVGSRGRNGGVAGVYKSGCRDLNYIDGFEY